MADVTLMCGDEFTPDITGRPNVTDTQDSNPSLTYQDSPSGGCRLDREWTAEDWAGNTNSFTQIITFTSSQPPELSLPANKLLACGDPVEDDRTAEDLVREGLLYHPCNRSMQVHYIDSIQQKLCGMTFTRTWTVEDDCGGTTQSYQTVTILELVLPEQPQNNQISVDLDIVLKWPPYPGAVRHELFIWIEGEEIPETPIYITTGYSFRNEESYQPSTRYMWKVDYALGSEYDELYNTTVIPSPIWTFLTRTFADFVVTDVSMPSSAFSGKDLMISWTVQNIGSRGSGVSKWYDYVYLSLQSDFTSLTWVATKTQTRFLDPNDGYVSSVNIRLKEDQIGMYYAYVLTDGSKYVTDYDRNNNMGRSDVPVNVRLTPPPDLMVSTIIVPETTFSGRAHLKIIQVLKLLLI